MGLLADNGFKDFVASLKTPLSFEAELAARLAFTVALRLGYEAGVREEHARRSASIQSALGLTVRRVVE